MGYRAVSSTENSVLPETTSHSPPKPSQDRPVIGVLGKRAMSAARTVLARPWARAGSAVTAARPRLITVKAVVTARAAVDRKRGVEGKRVSVRCDLGCRRIIKKKKAKRRITK